MTVKEERMRKVVASIEGEYRRYKALGEGAFKQLSETELTRTAPGEGPGGTGSPTWGRSSSWQNRSAAR
jgi:hypothetical protein